MKKIYLKSILLLFLIVLVNLMCRKDDGLINPEEIIISEEVNIIPEQVWDSYFVSYDSIAHKIVFKNEILDDHNIKLGEIIISDQGEGMLRKVSNIQTSSNEVVISTSVASITDVIEQGNIEFNSSLNVSQIKSIEYHYDGIKLKSENVKNSQESQFNWDINAVIYDYDGQSVTTFDQIKLEGNFTCDWSISGKIKIGLGKGIKEVDFGFNSYEELNLNLIAGLGYDFEKKVTLATVNFSPIIITAGAIPIVFTPQLKVIAGIDGYANASITTSFEQNLTFSAGIRYLKSDGWAPYSDFTNNFEYFPPQLNLNAGAEAYLKPELNLKIYGIAGPYANLKLYSKLDADLLTTPWWVLKAGVSLNAGAKVEIFDKFLMECKIDDILNKEVLLAQATTTPVPLPILTTSEVSNITGTTAICGGNISNEGGSSVIARGVCWSTSENPTKSSNYTDDGTGSGLFTSNINGLIANTRYYVRAYAINSEGIAYGNQVSFITANGNNGEGTTFENFAITNDVLPYNSDWNQVINEIFGSTYRVCDWNDLEEYYNNGGDLLALFDGLGLTEYRSGASVTRNGNPSYSSTRSYFASRHEHNKPSNYLAHDNIDNYLISLGSWYGNRKIIAIKK